MPTYDTTEIGDWVRLIEAEYREVPGLTLTKPQVRRLWGLDEETCEEVLRALEEDEHFLRRTERDAYVLARR